MSIDVGREVVEIAIMQSRKRNGCHEFQGHRILRVRVDAGSSQQYKNKTETPRLLHRVFFPFLVRDASRRVTQSSRSDQVENERPTRYEVEIVERADATSGLPRESTGLFNDTISGALKKSQSRLFSSISAGCKP